MADMEGLIRQLWDHRTRAQAMKELLMAGADAVEPLVEVLDHPMESARWAAVTVLGKIGDARALPALQRKADDPAVASAVVDAVQLIEQRVRKAAPAPPVGGVAAPTPSPMSQGPVPYPDAAIEGDRIVSELIPGTSIVDLGQSGTIRALRVDLPDGRKQVVKMNLDGRDEDGERLVVCYTACGPATPEHYEGALRYNMKMHFAALAIVDLDGAPNFVMVDSHLADGLDLTALRRSVLELARRGDALEKALTNQDLR